MSALRFIVAAIVALAAAGVIAVLLRREAIEAVLGPALTVETYRFLLVAVLGGGVTLVYNQFRAAHDRLADARLRERERARERREELRRIWDELSSLYESTLRRVSASRAMLSHAALDPDWSAFPGATYLAIIEEIAPIQSALATLHQRMRSQRFVWDDLDAGTNVLGMADYLGGVVGERERAMAKPRDAAGGGGLVERATVPHLMDLLGEPTDFEPRWGGSFQSRYHRAVERIAAAVLSDAP